MSEIQRARKPEQKELRRTAILDASWALYQESHFVDISMADVAKAASLAKGTLYLYFKTKEELFLTLLTERVGAIFEILEEELAKIKPGQPLTTLKAAVLKIVEQEPYLVRLMTIATMLLERNTNPGSLLRYKETMLGHVARSGQLIEEKFPILAKGEGNQLIMSIDAMLKGVYQSSTLPPNVKATFDANPHVKMLEINLEEFLTHLVETHLSGLIQRKKNEED